MNRGKIVLKNLSDIRKKSMMNIPLAERLRPKTLQEIYGQNHITAAHSMLSHALLTGTIPSLILWGAPGVGKTTLAQVIATQSGKKFVALSAVQSGVKEVRDAIQYAKEQDGCILFIDEIHRFNKSQQDALLHAVEKGTITLIGATTENPSFEVNSALLSRCQVLVLNTLGKDDMLAIVQRAISKDELLSQKNIQLLETDALLKYSGGDARKLLNLLELCVTQQSTNPNIVIDNNTVLQLLQTKMALYDKNGEQHYDLISAFIKSMRGSDPNATVYWLARMLHGGEDVKFIARRMLIFAAEDIGNANPNALLMANTTFDAVSKIGYPESRIILSQCAIYLATCTKSNSAYMAIEHALSLVKKTGDLSVPLHLRNAPTQLMKELEYGKNYQYDHNEHLHFSGQEFLPKEISNHTLYEPGDNVKESEIRKFLKARWKEKYRY